jgi:hypothetical protein
MEIKNLILITILIMNLVEDSWGLVEHLSKDRPKENLFTSQLQLITKAFSIMITTLSSVNHTSGKSKFCTLKCSLTSPNFKKGLERARDPNNPLPSFMQVKYFIFISFNVCRI